MRTRPSLVRFVLVFAALAFLKSLGCDGSAAGCGGCGARPLSKPLKTILERGIQVRITRTGFDFIEQNLKPILEQFLPNGLKFCIPGQCQSYSYDFGWPIGRVEFFRYGLCRNSNNGSCAASTPYRDGICTNACQVDLNLRTVDIRPNNATDTLQIYLLFDRILTNLFVSARSDIASITGSCSVSVSSNSFPVTADMALRIDPATKRLTFDRNLNARIDLSNLNVQAGATGNMQVCDPFGLGICISVCPIFDALVDVLVNNDTIRTLLLAVLQQPISDAVNNFADTLRCVQCDGSRPCPSGTTCQSGRCVFAAGPNAGQCLPTPVGSEGEFDAGGMVQSVSPGLKAILRYAAYAGSFVDVVNDGVTSGMLAGFDAEPSDCVPDVGPPSAAAVPRATKLDGNFVPCDAGDTACVAQPTPYKAAVAVSRRMFEHVFNAIYRSGLLCLTVGTEVTDFLSTENFALFLPSIARLTGGKNRPMILRTQPTEPPQITFGRGLLRRDAAGNLVLDQNGMPIIEDPLLTLRIPNLKLLFHALVDDRYVRLFDVSVDATFPLALYFQPDGSMTPVAGNLSNALSNVRVSPSRILKEEPDILAGILELALPQALPALTRALENARFRIPPVQGFQLVLDDRRLKAFQDGSPPEDFIGLFSELVFTPTARPMQMVVDTEARLVRLDVPPASTYALRPGRGLPRARAVLELSGRGPDGTAADLEYQWRLDGGPWSLFTPSRRVVVESPLLLLQGHHQIEVRARHREHQRALDPSPAVVRFIVDSVAPTLTLALEADRIRLEGRDGVTAPERLRYAWRVNGGPWSSFGPAREIPLAGLAPGLLRVEAKVRDESGNEGTATRVFAFHGQHTGGTDCQNGGCGASGSGGGLLAVLGALAALILARRRIPRTLPLLLAAGAMALALGACSDDTGGRPRRCLADTDCPNYPDEICHLESGVCVPKGGCRTDDDCGPGRYCAGDLDGDGRNDCAFRRCTQDADCATEITCGSGKRPTCEAGACVCGEPCGGACPEGTFCCLATNACTALPAACVVSCTRSSECASFGTRGTCVGGRCGCAPGHTLNVRSQGQLNPNTCQITGVQCTCDENPALPMGDAGRWADAALLGTDIWVSAYNATYGDLMVGKYDALQGTVASWTFVDGVPPGGAVTHGPSGPRGGVAEPGDDVGQYTSIAAASDGAIHVAYHDATHAVLKYARGVPGAGGTLAFETHVVDTEGKNGRYTSLLLDATGRPAIAYMAMEVPDGAARKSRLRLARAASAAPRSASDWTRTTLHEVTLPARPCGGGCPAGEACVQSGPGWACAEVGTCSPACGAGEACVGGACRPVYQPSSIEGLPEGTGLFNSLALAGDGTLWVAFYDRSRGNLMLVSHGASGPGTPMIVDGETPAGEDTGDVGQWASLKITADGTKHLTAVNATSDDLWYFKVTGSTAVGEVVDTGLRTAAGEPIGPNNPEPASGPAVIAESRLVGDDSSLFIDENGVIRIAYMDSSQIALLYAKRDAASGKWGIEVLAGNETPYAGAYGFHIAHVQGWILNYKFNLKNETSGLDFRRAP